MIIAIIPARSGSKRIKNKNIKSFCGLPVISYSIKEALKSKIFDKIVVSTDSSKIAKIAKKYGAEVPYLRSKKLSKNTVGIPDVMKDAVNYYENNNIIIDYACLIYAASPLIKYTDLKKGFNKIKSNKFDFVISISKFVSPIHRSLYIDNKNLIRPLNKKNTYLHSQNFNEFYYDNAQFTFGKKNAWIKNKHTFLVKSSFVKIPSYRSQDIDTLEDWKRSELLYKINKYEKI